MEKNPTVTFFGTVHHSGGCGGECLGAIELLRAHNVPVRVIVPNDDNPAKAYLWRLGVQLMSGYPLEACELMMCFGEGIKLLELMGQTERKPSYLAYSDCMSFVTDVEVELHAAGLVDEFFFQSRRLADKSAKEIAQRGKRNVEVRHGYKAFINPRSEYLPLRFGRRDPADKMFRVLKVGRDHEEKWHPDTWRMMCGISAPGRAEFGNVEIEVAGWGPEGRKKAGDPEEASSPWHRQLNLQLHGQIDSGAEMAALYARSDVLLHICDPGYEEAAARVILEAQLAGVVVVADNRGGNKDLIVNGETGYLVDTPEEATYRCTELAFHPRLRRVLAGNAYARLTNGGHADADACWRWWEGLLEKAGGQRTAGDRGREEKMPKPAPAHLGPMPYLVGGS